MEGREKAQLNETGEKNIQFEFFIQVRYLIPSVPGVPYPPLLLLVLLLAINYCRRHEIDENMGQDVTTGVNDRGNNLSPVTVTPAMIYRNCQINTKSLRIFIKIKIRPNGTLRGPEDTES